jgi:hypothetical protein
MQIRALANIYSVYFRVSRKNICFFLPQTTMVTVCITKKTGRMFNFLNNLRHDSLESAFFKILIILFCNTKILLLWGKFPQKISPNIIIEYM